MKKFNNFEIVWQIEKLKNIKKLSWSVNGEWRVSCGQWTSVMLRTRWAMESRVSCMWWFDVITCSWCHCKKKYSSGIGKNESQNGNSRNVFIIIRNSFGHVGCIWDQYGLIWCLLGIMYRCMIQKYIENSYNV